VFSCSSYAWIAPAGNQPSKVAHPTASIQDIESTRLSQPWLVCRHSTSDVDLH
jgi:hypothetical protein